MEAYIFFALGVAVGIAVSYLIFYRKTGRGSLTLNLARKSVVLTIPLSVEELNKKRQIIVAIKKADIKDNSENIWEEQEYGRNEN